MKYTNVVVTSSKNYGRGVTGFFTNVREFQSLAESLATQGYLSEQGSIGLTAVDERETAQWQETLDSLINRLEAVSTADRDRTYLPVFWPELGLPSKGRRRDRIQTTYVRSDCANVFRDSQRD
jgi:hypothetical protein